MPHFVTDIHHADPALRAAAPHAVALRAVANGRSAGARAYRRRLASLQTSAPDTLRARVRRDLRLAVATSRPE